MFSSFSTFFHLIQRAWVCLCWVSVEEESMTTTAQKGQKSKKGKTASDYVWFSANKNFKHPKSHFQRPSRSHWRAGALAALCHAGGVQRAPWYKVGNFVVVMLMVIAAVVVVVMMMLLICCSTVGLIYVNPGGPADNPGVPAASAKNIRSVGFSSWNTLILLICKKQEHLWSHEYERFRDCCSHWWVGIECPWI